MVPNCSRELKKSCHIQGTQSRASLGDSSAVAWANTPLSIPWLTAEMKRQPPDGKKFAGPLTGSLALAGDLNHNNSTTQMLQSRAW